MKIVSAPDGVVGRVDRALWVTRPFDLAFASPANTTVTFDGSIPTRIDGRIEVLAGEPEPLGGLIEEL